MPHPVIIGGGLAGLTTALSLAQAMAPHPVTLLLAHTLNNNASSLWAQGGLAAAVAPDDSPDRHAQDTLAAGAGLCHPDVVRFITQDAKASLQWLEEQGVTFDRDHDGKLSLGLEGAHSRRRIIHADGDASGFSIMQSLMRKAQSLPNLTIREHHTAHRIISNDHGHVTGLWVIHGGQLVSLPTNHLVLATGGIGGLWLHTTNPLSSWGSGLALAAKAGATLANLEFMQFHPTAIAAPLSLQGQAPLPLASEALRGEGAVLIDETGASIMAFHPQKDLAARDIVSRALWEHKGKGHAIFLDTRMIQNFASRFPSITHLCQKAGIEPGQSPIPICPAAHYHMGGVITDTSGRTTIPGLWAVGEVAMTGLHGANRLASNSLLEAVVMGRQAAVSILNTSAPKTTAMASQETAYRPPTTDPMTILKLREQVTHHLGGLRHAAGLQSLLDWLSAQPKEWDMALVARLIALSALRRQESRGAHTRTDFPTLSDTTTDTRVTLNDLTP